MRGFTTSSRQGNGAGPDVNVAVHTCRAFGRIQGLLADGKLGRYNAITAHVTTTADPAFRLTFVQHELYGLHAALSVLDFSQFGFDT